MLRKRKVNHMLKKSAAILTASAMVIAVPVTAMAEGTTYNEREKAALKSLSEAIAADWDEGLAQMAGNDVNANMELKLTVGDAGKSMLGMMTGMDVSWLNNIILDMKASINESKEAAVMNVLLNGSNICTMNMLLNMLEQMEYVQIPELAPGWLKVDMNQALEEDADSYALYLQFADLSSDPSRLFSEGAEISDLLERYGSIVIDHLQEGASVDEMISVDGISEDCTLLEGLLYQEDAKEMVKDILTTAQADEQIKELLTRWSEAMPDAGDLNEQFQTAVSEALADFEAEKTEEATEDTADASEYIASRIWVNADNKIVGREIALCEGVNDTDNVLTWKAPKNGDTSALLLEVQSDGSGFAINGNGQTVDGVMNGNYTVAVDGVTMMEVAMENYDSQAGGEGYPAGTFTITFPQGENEEEYNPLSAFSLVFTLSSSKEDSSVDMNLALLSSGASLCDLNLHTVSFGEAPEEISEEGMETVYDMTNEDDMNTYAEAISFDTIKANAEAAGVPAEVITMITESVEASLNGETEEYPEELEDDIMQEEETTVEDNDAA